MKRAALPAAALLASLAGCATGPPLGASLPAGAPASVELVATPFFPQQDHQCGPAALATVLSVAGPPVTPDDLVGELFIPARQGSLQAEMLGATRRAGLMPYVLPPRNDALLAEILEGRPVVVLQNLGAQSWPVWHYAVLIGYDAGRDAALLRSGRRGRLETRWSRFAAAWERGGRWAFTALVPGTMPAAVEPDRFLEAAAGLESAGRLDAAAAAYRAATERWPDTALGWLGLGNVAHARGELPAAVEAFARGVRRAPEHAALRNNLAQALLDAGCAEQALGQARAAARLAHGTALGATVQATLAQAERLAADPRGSRCDPGIGSNGLR